MYEEVLVKKYLGKDMSQLKNSSSEELDEIIVDIVNEREGVRENSKKGIELDDLYNIVDGIRNSRKIKEELTKGEQQ